ncbi:hypothetical protein LINGRAHAP2_LOCUS4858 [Linum grandiflorum]
MKECYPKSEQPIEDLKYVFFQHLGVTSIISTFSKLISLTRRSSC